MTSMGSPRSLSAGGLASADVHLQIDGLAMPVSNGLTVPVHAGATRPLQSARVSRTNSNCEDLVETEISLDRSSKRSRTKSRPENRPQKKKKSRPSANSDWSSVK